MRFKYDLGEDQEFSYCGISVLSISPDGSQFVYSTRKGLYLRSLDQLDARPISGTDGNSLQPLFSPDRKWICYYSAEDNKSKKISINGGVSTTLCNAMDPRHPSWDFDDAIIFAQEQGIMRISPDGGSPEVIVKGEAYGEPQILPDEKTALFAFNDATGNKKIAIQSLESEERKDLFEGDNPRYVSTGHIVYTLGSNLFARPFDLAELEMIGGPISIVEGVFHAGIHSQYAISKTGTIVYIPAFVTGQSQLEWHGREGNLIGSVGDPAPYEQFSLSFDEKRAAIEQKEKTGFSLWVMDLDRGGVREKITSGNFYDRDPIWSPDGRYIFFFSDRDDSNGLYRKLLGGEEKLELLFESEGELCPEDCSDDGRFIMYRNSDGIYVLRLNDGQNQSEVVLRSESNTYDEPEFSPDAEWIAYDSDESGQFEVYIRPFNGNIEKRIVSTQGGGQPQWRGDGKELFYLALDGTMMAVELKGETLIPGNPTPLFQTGIRVNPRDAQYAVTRDGQKFLIRNSVVAGDSSSIIIVANWFEELKDRMP